jgi:hypothetical protein
MLTNFFSDCLRQSSEIFDLSDECILLHTQQKTKGSDSGEKAGGNTEFEEELRENENEEKKANLVDFSLSAEKRSDRRSEFDEDCCDTFSDESGDEKAGTVISDFVDNLASFQKRALPRKEYIDSNENDSHGREILANTPTAKWTKVRPHHENQNSDHMMFRGLKSIEKRDVISLKVSSINPQLKPRVKNHVMQRKEHESAKESNNQDNEDHQKVRASNHTPI